MQTYLSTAGGFPPLGSDSPFMTPYWDYLFFLEADVVSLGQILQGVSFTIIPQNICLGF